jgi:hypothetical protein
MNFMPFIEYFNRLPYTKKKLQKLKGKKEKKGSFDYFIQTGTGSIL